jgi:Flp pilus assembly protein TadG
MTLFSLIAGSARRLRRNDEGQALVEFALIVPFLLVFMIGIIEFGRAWNLHQVVTDAAREGARRGAIYDPVVTPDTVHNTVMAALRAAGADTTKATVSIVDGGEGMPITVNVGLRYRFVFFGALKQWTTGESTITLATSVTMRNE